MVDVPATGTGPYTASWTPAALGQYTGYWTFAGGYRRFHLEVTDAPIVSVAEVRAFDSALVSRDRYPGALVAGYRDAVEEEFEMITGRAFTVRARRLAFTADGQGNILVPDIDVQRVTTLLVDGAPRPELVGAIDAGLVDIAAPAGAACAVVYEYGTTPPPHDVRRAALLRVRDVLLSGTSAIPDRAVSWQVTDQGTYQLATAGRAGYETGVPEVDAILGRYKVERWAY
ncbi:hypothetical protein [Streptomyces sp. NPDC050507]|uniref:hypothetical protein n=1 Tax=Streptomyces sp. NPDC050507 TaxID=3365619 RepID=UPI0037B67F12